MRHVPLAVGLGLGLLHFALAPAAFGQVAGGNVKGRVLDAKGLPVAETASPAQLTP